MNELATQPEAPKPWYELRKRRQIVTSATQHEQLERCPRQWWLERVRRLPVPPKGSQVFGTILHSVCERYLSADDLGYDKTGRPVDLYPPDWNIAIDKYTGGVEGIITPAEMSVIQLLVAAAIEDGTLQRRPRRQVEKQFRMTLADLECPTCKSSGRVFKPCVCLAFGKGSDPECRTCGGSGSNPEEIVSCPTCNGDGKGTNVQITGFIDLLYPESVEDHKSTSKMAYAKSKAKLKVNLQMLAYAKVCIEEAKARGEPPPERVLIRHNVYCKNPDDLRVRKTEEWVTREEIERNWDALIRNAAYMDHLRRNANSWNEIPEPPTGSQACNAFGGCPFRTICGGRESEQGYEDRLARWKASSYTPLSIKGQETPHPPIYTSAQLGESGMTQAQSFAGQVAQARAGTPMPPGMAAHAAPAINPPRPAGMVPSAPSAPAPFSPPAPGTFTPPQAPSGPPATPPGMYNPPPAPAAPTYVPPPAPAPAPPVQPQAPQFTLTPPPWADPADVACRGLGFDTQGRPCPICAALGEKKAGWVPDHFDMVEAGPGVIRWTAKHDPNIQGFSPLAANSTVAQESRTTPSPAAVAPSAPAAAKPVEEAEEDADEKGGKGGRPPKSFTLCINCGVIRGDEARGTRKVIHLDQVLAECGAEMAKISNAATFYDLDAFQRRDALAKAAPALAKGFKNATVVAIGVGRGAGDLKSLVEALMPFAGMVIAAVESQ